MQNFAYLLADLQHHVAAVIDPGWEAEQLHRAATGIACTVTQILLTHTHFDHMDAVTALQELTHAPVFVHETERFRVNTAGPCHALHDGQQFQIGTLSVEVLHTPGHSPGGVSFLTANTCFTGDTLFVDGCGRVDLPGSDPHAMFRSLRRLAALPAGTIIYPGHDYGPTPTSTIGAQKERNPYLRAETEAEFFHNRVE